MPSSKAISWAVAAFLLAASMSCHSAEVGGQKVDHARTIDELLNAETTTLSNKGRSAPTDTKRAVLSAPEPTEVLAVDAVWGVTGAKKATVSLDGYKSTVGVDDFVGRFRVRSIAKGCVVLEGKKKAPVASKPQGKHSGKAGLANPFGDAEVPDTRRVCFVDNIGTNGFVPSVAPVRSTGPATQMPIVPPVMQAAPAAVPLTQPGLSNVQLPR